MGTLSETILDIMKLLPSSAQDLIKNRLTTYVKNFDHKEETVQANAAEADAK
jgi:hypothetical protein